MKNYWKEKSHIEVISLFRTFRDNLIVSKNLLYTFLGSHPTRYVSVYLRIVNQKTNSKKYTFFLTSKHGVNFAEAGHMLRFLLFYNNRSIVLKQKYNPRYACK